MISAKSKAKALSLLRAGVPHREVAQRAGISKGTVAGLARALRAAETLPVPPAPNARPRAAAGARAEELTRCGVDEALAMAERAAADGNTSAASKFIRDALQGANTLARIEASQRGKTDDIVIPIAKFEQTKREMLERVQRLAADLQRTGGMVCSACGRALRLKLASDSPADPSAPKP